MFILIFMEFWFVFGYDCETIYRRDMWM